ncbi:hypothetical protein SY88_07575 [Clostridiales bacterium PH28_bin88]|nr:hypothetical protein SY88_07575 [Clostridiales bacterium PH28_bin88]
MGKSSLAQAKFSLNARKLRLVPNPLAVGVVRGKLPYFLFSPWRTGSQVGLPQEQYMLRRGWYRPDHETFSRVIPSEVTASLGQGQALVPGVYCLTRRGMVGTGTREVYPNRQQDNKQSFQPVHLRKKLLLLWLIVSSNNYQCQVFFYTANACEQLLHLGA